MLKKDLISRIYEDKKPRNIHSRDRFNQRKSKLLPIFMTGDSVTIWSNAPTEKPLLFSHRDRDRVLPPSRLTFEKDSSQVFEKGISGS